MLQDPREEEGACATLKGPVDPLFLEQRTWEEDGPTVPTCALREEEESDVLRPVFGTFAPEPEFCDGEPREEEGSPSYPAPQGGGEAPKPYFL